MSLTVLEAGLYSLLLDAGRPTGRHLGVPVGGAADTAAWQLANSLLGNDPTLVALELTMRGPTLRAEHATAAVIFGAPFQAAVGNRGRIEPGTTFTLEPGDVLKIGGTPTGVRGYLCVGNGFDAPMLLNSRSQLEPVTAGQLLVCGESRTTGRSFPFVQCPGETSDHLRVVLGPQFDWFLDPEPFFNTDYDVLPASNRMGVRLNGPKLERRVGEMISEPVAPGAVQIANDGQPIILGVDGQTIGGYPKIAHVIRADLDRLAQLRPGEQVRFVRVTPEQAAAAAADKSATIRHWQLRRAVVGGV